MLAGALLACTLAACVDGARRDEAAIGELIVSLVAADNRADLDAVAALYAGDAVLLPPFESPVVGIDAIRDRYREMFETMGFELGATIEETVVEGNWAYSRGMTRGRAMPRDGQGWRSVNDRYLMVLRKDGGRWHITRLMWNAEQ